MTGNLTFLQHSNEQKVFERFLQDLSKKTCFTEFKRSKLKIKIRCKYCNLFDTHLLIMKNSLRKIKFKYVPNIVPLKLKK